MCVIVLSLSTGVSETVGLTRAVEIDVVATDVESATSLRASTVTARV